MLKKTISITQLGLATALFGLSMAWGSGFQLFEESVTGMGNVHADWAAGVDDASTGFYNPAGLTRIHNQQLILGASLINLNINYTGTSSTSLLIGNALFPSFGPVSGNASGGTFNTIPEMHYAAPLGDDTTFGLDVTVPFGLSTKWSNDSIVRYANLVTQVQAIDVSPSFGLALTKRFSIGAGWDFYRLDATFSDMAGIGNNNNSDAVIDNIGHDYESGWHAGWQFDLTPKTVVGMTYYSAVKYHMHGKSDYINIGSAVAGNPNTASWNLSSDVTLPAVTAFSIAQELNDKWRIMATALRTQWSCLPVITLNNVNLNGTPIQVSVPQNFRNTWLYSIGADYKQSDKVTWRAGIGFDKNPTNDIDRNLRLPDGDRIMLGAGAHYQASQNLGFDVGYEHVFIRTAGINNTQLANIPGAFEDAATVNGTATSSADVMGAQMVWNFS